MWPTEFRTNWMPCSGRCFNILHMALTYGLVIFRPVDWKPSDSCQMMTCRSCGTVVYLAAQGNLWRQNMPTCISVGLLNECLWWLFLTLAISSPVSIFKLFSVMLLLCNQYISNIVTYMLSINSITSVYMYKYNVHYCLGGCRHWHTGLWIWETWTVWQHLVLVLCCSKVEFFFCNARLQPQYDDSEFCSLSYLDFNVVLALY